MSKKQQKTLNQYIDERVRDYQELDDITKKMNELEEQRKEVVTRIQKNTVIIEFLEEAQDPAESK